MKALISTRKEKGDLVIKLAEEGKPTRQIAVVHMSLEGIGKIKRRYTGEEEPTERKIEP